MKIKKIFKREIALQLVSMGHKLIYTEPNRNIENFVVFCFEEDNKLLNDLTKLTH
ncbi:hypothetical protein G8E05_10720 [Clostridium botulinum]|uniref:hypothetical protein n=1 Tax=Clostridium botulinum TaxID=1491 RepID=UPI00016BA27F|nr:hypothetical protein [Clostridium botulinum]AJD26103.1 hypothetical protein T257_302 [Clostridium botulinum CDC_297]EPS47086.1 hypothetical protein CFSAN002368_25722 [Clostridium botulinum A1 str. CFSAN002368]AJE11130.1 hypothetical protein T259_2952 [Clostridium botulinum CDC_1436]EDT84584.1 conserved hypothetical protein [Clostridium botulinum Bf]MBY6878117.1 hypothetical protein [Clostridium botulinum]